MAVSLAWGLAFGTMITLFATPILYNMFADVKKKVLKQETDIDKDEGYYEIESDVEKRISKDIEEKFKHYIDDSLGVKTKDKRKTDKAKPKKKGAKTRKKPGKK